MEKATEGNEHLINSKEPSIQEPNSFLKNICVNEQLDEEKHLELFRDYVAGMLAQGEAERVIEGRKALQEVKRRGSENVKAVNTFDQSDDLENALEIVECLPQGSRGVQAPHEGFLQLGKDVAGEAADAEQKLLYALLLEEYALELLEPHIVKLPYGRIGDKLSPWAVRSNGVPGTASKPAALPSDSSRRIARMMHDVLESSDEREHRLAELVRLRAEQVRTKRRGNSPGMSRKHIKKRRLDVYKEDGDGVGVEYSSDEIHSSQDSN